jgi:hypothetical protein
VNGRSGAKQHPSLLSGTDVKLYSLIHRILEAEHARDVGERRSGRRHPYECIQWIAPVNDAGEGTAEFQPVRCLDLSADGLLFLADEAPCSDELVVALGSERTIRLHAKVVRVKKIVQQKRIVHRVACRFVGRAA